MGLKMLRTSCEQAAVDDGLARSFVPRCRRRFKMRRILSNQQPPLKWHTRTTEERRKERRTEDGNGNCDLNFRRRRRRRSYKLSTRALAGRTAKLPKGVATEDDSDTVCMSTARFASTTNGKQGRLLRHYPS